MPTSPSLQAIADAAQMAKSTVSYALRDDPKISIKTRQRIRSLAQKMGYKVNPLVGVFMTHLRSTRKVPYEANLAWITAHSTEDGWKKNRSSELFREGVRLRCEERGYRLEDFWMRQPGMNAKRQKKILEARGIRGIVVGSLPVSMGHSSIDLSRLAAITGGYSVSRPNIDRVACDAYHAVLNLLRKAYALGYRRLGLAYSIGQDRRMEYFISAALSTYEMNLPRHTQLIALKFEERRSDLPKVIERWLDRQSPDFVMGDTPHIAELIRRTGRTLPDDIGFGALNRLPEETHVAGIDQNHALAGQTAADFIINKIQANDYGIPQHPRIVLIQGEWREGPTAIKRR